MANKRFNADNTFVTFCAIASLFNAQNAPIAARPVLRVKRMLEGPSGRGTMKKI